MASAQMSEQELKDTPPAPEPHKALPPPEQPETGSRSSSARKWIILLVILLVIGAAVWKIRSNTEEQAGQGEKMAAMADRPTPVQVQAVQQRTMPIYLSALGTVTAYNTVTIKPRVDGQLLRVLFREGQKVSQGQLLMEIDPRPYQAALAQAQGQLTRDQANSKNAEAEAGRYTALFQAGVVSKESQQAQISTAGQATGAIQADQAAIQAAQVNLAYTKITSPINGVVGLRQVDPGNIVHAADANGLLVVTQLQPISVIFTLPEDHLPQVLDLTRGGHKLAVDAFDRSEANHLATGSLLTVDNQIDTTTGTVKGKAVFDNRDEKLFPNQFVNVRLILQQRQNSLVVPAAAIQTGTQGTFVYVVKPGEPPADKQTQNNGGSSESQAGGGTHRRHGGSKGAAAGNGEEEGPKTPPAYVAIQPVKVDLTEGSNVILASGVNAGDQIVVDGQEKLKDGSRVIPRQGNAATRNAGGTGMSNPPNATDGTPAATKAQQDRQGNAQTGNRGQRP